MASECQTTRGVHHLPLRKRQFAETESTTLLANPLHRRALTRFLFRLNFHFHIGKLVKRKLVLNESSLKDDERWPQFRHNFLLLLNDDVIP